MLHDVKRVLCTCFDGRAVWKNGRVESEIRISRWFVDSVLPDEVQNRLTRRLADCVGVSDWRDIHGSALPDVRQLTRSRWLHEIQPEHLMLLTLGSHPFGVCVWPCTHQQGIRLSVSQNIGASAHTLIFVGKHDGGIVVKRAVFTSTDPGVRDIYPVRSGLEHWNRTGQVARCPSVLVEFVITRGLWYPGVRGRKIPFVSHQNKSHTHPRRFVRFVINWEIIGGWIIDVYIERTSMSAAVIESTHRPSHAHSTGLPPPHEWGSHVWYTMEVFAKGYGDHPNPKLKKDANDFYNAIANMLPCEDCRKHYASLLKKRPVRQYLQNSQRLLEWIEWVKLEVNKTVEAKKQSDARSTHTSETQQDADVGSEDSMNIEQTKSRHLPDGLPSTQTSLAPRQSPVLAIRESRNPKAHTKTVTHAKAVTHSNPRRRDMTGKERLDLARKRYQRPCSC